MKIYNRTDFLNLPDKTVYCKILNGVQGFGDIEIKEESWDVDWYSSTLNIHMNAPFEECGEFPALGDEFTFDLEGLSRDGLYEREELYAVFDNNDINSMIDKLKTCLK